MSPLPETGIDSTKWSIVMIELAALDALDRERRGPEVVVAHEGPTDLGAERPGAEVQGSDREGALGALEHEHLDTAAPHRHEQRAGRPVEERVGAVERRIGDGAAVPSATAPRAGWPTAGSRRRARPWACPVVAESAMSVRPTIRLGVTCRSLGTWQELRGASDSRMVTSWPLVLPTTMSLLPTITSSWSNELMPVRRAVHAMALVVGFHRTTQLSPKPKAATTSSDPAIDRIWSPGDSSSDHGIRSSRGQVGAVLADGAPGGRVDEGGGRQLVGVLGLVDDEEPVPGDRDRPVRGREPLRPERLRRCRAVGRDVGVGGADDQPAADGGEAARAPVGDLVAQGGAPDGLAGAGVEGHEVVLEHGEHGVADDSHLGPVDRVVEGLALPPHLRGSAVERDPGEPAGRDRVRVLLDDHHDVGAGAVAGRTVPLPPRTITELLENGDELPASPSVSHPRMAPNRTTPTTAMMKPGMAQPTTLAVRPDAGCFERFLDRAGGVGAAGAPATGAGGDHDPPGMGAAIGGAGQPADGGGPDGAGG